MMVDRTKTNRDRDKGKLKGPVMLIVYIVCFVEFATADESNCNNGVISPQNPYFLENESISLDCIKYGDEPIDLKFKESNRVVDGQYVHKINESAVKLDLPPLTLDQLNERKLSTHILCLDGDQCVKSIHVKREFYPRIPQDIHCYGNNWQQMNCSWSLGVQYKDPNNTEVICEVAYDNSLDLEVDKTRFDNLKWEKCPKLLDNTLCEWKGDDFYLWWRIYLRITVRNLRRNVSVSSDIMPFLFNEINQPAPVKSNKIFIMKEEDSCVHLKWRPHSKARNLMFNLTYTSDCGVRKSLMIRYKSPKKHARAKICDLHPFSTYTLTLSSRYLFHAHKQMGLWSMEAGKSFTTNMKVPAKSPDTLEGLYDQVSDTDKNLTVYWKPLERCDMYSEHVGYTITSDLEMEVEEGSAFVSQLTVGTLPINVAIQAWNQVGKATNMSKIKVFPSSLGPKPSELIVEYNIEGSRNLIISIINSSESNTSHVLVWCKGLDFCLEPVQWMNVTQSPISLEVEEITRFGLITYGYRDKQPVNTGIMWEKCSYKEGKSPSPPDLKPIQPETQPEEGFRVDWSPIECSNKETGYLKHYELIYCKVHDVKSKSCDEDAVKVEVSKRETSHIVTGLPDGSLYLVWLQAIGHRGLTEKSSAEIYKVQGKGKNVYYSLAIILISCMVVGIVVFVIVICYCRCRKRIKSIVQIDDPLIGILVDQDVKTSDVNSKLLGSIPDKNETNSNPDSGTSSINSNTTVLTYERDPLLSNFDSDSAINMNTEIFEKKDIVTDTHVAIPVEMTANHKHRNVSEEGLFDISDNLLSSYNRPSDISCGSVLAGSEINISNIYDTVDEINDEDDGINHNVEEKETEFNTKVDEINDDGDDIYCRDEIETSFNEGVSVMDSCKEGKENDMENEICNIITSVPNSTNREISLPQISQLRSKEDDSRKDDIGSKEITACARENEHENDLRSEKDIRNIEIDSSGDGFSKDGRNICDNIHTPINIPQNQPLESNISQSLHPELKVNQNQENDSFPDSDSPITHICNETLLDQNQSSAIESTHEAHEDDNINIPDKEDDCESSGFMTSGSLDGYTLNNSIDMDLESISDTVSLSGHISDTVSLSDDLSDTLANGVDQGESVEFINEAEPNMMKSDMDDTRDSLDIGSGCNGEKDINDMVKDDTKDCSDAGGTCKEIDVASNINGFLTDNDGNDEADKDSGDKFGKESDEFKNPSKNEIRDKCVNDLRTTHDIPEPGSQSSGDYQMVTVNSNSTIDSAAGSAQLDRKVSYNPIV